jgi:hypothetical protein
LIFDGYDADGKFMNIEISPKEYERKLNWHDAMMYCQLLSIDGKNDWRLPTKDELNDVYDTKNDIYHSENDFVRAYYWSSTEYDDNCARGQYFQPNGNQFNHGKKTISFYVRAVRTIE